MYQISLTLLSEDPNIEKYLKYTSFVYVYNNPILLIDPDGKDSTQRAHAIKKAREYVDKKPEGNSYEMSKKGNPGENVDCSGMVSKCIQAGDEKDPNYGGSVSGVANIQDHTDKKAEKEVQEGNIVTFKLNKGYPYHIGILESVKKDKNGNIISFTMIHSSSGKGPNEQTVTIGEGKFSLGNWIMNNATVGSGGHEVRKYLLKHGF